jgi:hypothetical protein
MERRGSAGSGHSQKHIQTAQIDPKEPHPPSNRRRTGSVPARIDPLFRSGHVCSGMAKVLRQFLHRAFLMFVVIAFIGAGALASASPVQMAGEPCPHERGPMHGDHQPKPHSHDSGPAGCLTCCLAACIVVPNLPPALVAARTPIVALIVYSRATPSLTGLSLVPDPAPPRPIA